MSAAAAVQKNASPVVRKRVLLQIDDRTLSDAIRDGMSAAGFEVHAIGPFKALAAWLLLHRDATLVIALPAIDFFRCAVLREVRRLAPTTRIIALAPSVTLGVQRDADEANVARIVPTGGSPTEVIELIKNACS